jgi:hypothetical protein
MQIIYTSNRKNARGDSSVPAHESEVMLMAKTILLKLILTAMCLSTPLANTKGT